jgi:hypothetical protein
MSRVPSDRDPQHGATPSAGTSSVCRLCGESLQGRRRDARYCCNAHRAEANRLLAILNGLSSAQYPSIKHRVGAATKRTRRFWGAP